MSTRSIIRVKLNGEYRVCQFVQSDGYPTCRGMEILKFVQNLRTDERENEFREKIQTAKSVITSFGKNTTYTGAPTNKIRYSLLSKTYQARFLPISESNKYGTKLRSWREAIEKLLAEKEINNKEAAWLVVAGRDSGIGALEWLMGHDEIPITFYMPEDLVVLPEGGGIAGCDHILGDYIIDMDTRRVICGYKGSCMCITFCEIDGLTDAEMLARMEKLENS